MERDKREKREERESKNFEINFNIFYVINVKYKEISWRVRKEKEKSNFQKHRVNSCLKMFPTFSMQKNIFVKWKIVGQRKKMPLSKEGEHDPLKTFRILLVI